MISAWSPSAGRALAAGCLLALSALAPADPSAPLSREGETIPGQRLEPAGFGPGVIETLEDALARERLRPPGRVDDPKARGERVGRWVVPSRRSVTKPASRRVASCWET